MKISTLIYDLKPQIYDKYPLDWKKIFGNKKKIYVEIGFGNGEFLAELAYNNLDINFVGFETSLTSMVKAQNLFYKKGLKNVRIILGDGKVLLRELFDNDTISKVIVNFPCPWPKKRHENRRLFHEDFIKTLAAVLKMGGILELATDVKWYAEWVVESFEKSGFFEIIAFEKNFRRKVKTRYEKKWEKEGRDKYLIQAKKIKNSTIKRMFLKEENDMPHVFVKNINEKAIFKLDEKEFSENEKFFTVKGVYKNSEGDRYLVRIISSDSGFQQHYYISIVKRSSDWIVKLDTTTIPYRTPAVKFSVHQIAKEIEKDL